MVHLTHRPACYAASKQLFLIMDYQFCLENLLTCVLFGHLSKKKKAKDPRILNHFLSELATIIASKLFVQINWLLHHIIHE
jgi:hypothetical protein